jgi:hypothetical protein
LTRILRDLAISFIRRHKAESCPFLRRPLRSPHAPTKALSTVAVLPSPEEGSGTGVGGSRQRHLVGAVSGETTRSRAPPVPFTSDNGKRHHNDPDRTKFEV